MVKLKANVSRFVASPVLATHHFLEEICEKSMGFLGVVLAAVKVLAAAEVCVKERIPAGVPVLDLATVRPSKVAEVKARFVRFHAIYAELRLLAAVHVASR